MEAAAYGVLVTLFVLGIVALLSLHFRKQQPSDTKSGMVFGPYERLTLLSGKGGMAKIYRAYNRETARDCVLKVLRQELLGNQEVIRKFRHEFEIMEQLKKADSTAPIPAVYGSGTISTGFVELPFLEMEYVPGDINLGDYLKERGKLSTAEATSIVAQISRALLHAHRLNIVHRDLKPANVLLSDGQADSIVVIDFGVAKLLDRNSETTGTYGTVAYMAPEQINRKAPPTTAIDVYALGMLWYELLVGHKLYDDENPVVTIARHQEGKASEEVTTGVPEEVGQLLAQMVALNPNDRPPIKIIAARLQAESTPQVEEVPSSFQELDEKNSKINGNIESPSEEIPSAFPPVGIEQDLRNKCENLKTATTIACVLAIFLFIIFIMNNCHSNNLTRENDSLSRRYQKLQRDIRKSDAERAKLSDSKERLETELVELRSHTDNLSVFDLSSYGSKYASVTRVQNLLIAEGTSPGSPGLLFQKSMIASEFEFGCDTEYVGPHSKGNYPFGLTFSGRDFGGLKRYLFGINDRGQYCFSKHVNSKWIDIVNWTSSSVAQTGRNRLGVRVVNNTFELFINGSKVRTVTGQDRYSGYVGMFLHPSQKVRFSNISFSHL